MGKFWDIYIPICICWEYFQFLVPSFFPSQKVFWFVSCLNFSPVTWFEFCPISSRSFLSYDLTLIHKFSLSIQMFGNLSCFQITPGSLLLIFHCSLLVFGHDICHFSYIFDLGLYVQYFSHLLESECHIVFYEASFFLNIKKKTTWGQSTVKPLRRWKKMR